MSFYNTRGAGVPKTVSVSRIVTETELLHRSRDLEDSLTQGKFSEFCGMKVEGSANVMDRNIWNFMKVRP